MTTAAAPVRAALIGLPPDYHGIPEHIRPLVAKSIANVHDQMAEAGVQYEFYGVTPEDLSDLGPRLESQRPDVVTIGNGIRSSMEMTHFMEQVIDVVRTSAPQAKLTFNTVPGDTIDAVRRWFPIAAAPETSATSEFVKADAVLSAEFEASKLR